MKTILFKCPNPECSDRHALCYQVGSKQELGVICNKPSKPKFFRVDEQISPEDLEGIPTYYTAAAKKKLEQRQNMQFVMMNVKDGEQVERVVELPRPDYIDEIKYKMQHHIEMISVCEDEIAKIETERAKHKSEAQRLSCELSKLQTTPLFEEYK